VPEERKKYETRIEDGMHNSCFRGHRETTGVSISLASIHLMPRNITSEDLIPPFTNWAAENRLAES